MIKDIILYLERDQSHDHVRDYALSIAETLEAHVTGVAFAHDPDVSGQIMPNFPAQMLAEMRAESEKGARAAIERFEAAAKRSLLSTEHCLVVENELRFPSTYSSLARRFDLRVRPETSGGIAEFSEHEAD